MDYTCIKETAEKYGAEILFNENTAKYTSFNIGGSCDVLVKANSAECIRGLIASCRKNSIKYYVFGKCSNILISDNGLRGVVILISGDYSGISVDDTLIECEAGATLSKVCLTARDKCLSGMEFAYGIPGTVGGGLYMNAGAYGGEMKDIVEYCTYLNEKGEIVRSEREELDLSYRHSRFTGTGDIILTVGLRLKKGDKEEISARMNELMGKRKSSQPLEYPSAGSTFKRPEGDFAARLIEASGLKGYSCGGAEVSEKHSGFVINKNNATAEDVLKVVEGVKKKVFEDSGIMLECEMLIIE